MLLWYVIMLCYYVMLMRQLRPTSNLTIEPSSEVSRAGLPIVPFVPWQGAPAVRGPPLPASQFFLIKNVILRRAN